MQIAVLSSPDSWHYKDLERASEAKHELIPVAFSRLASSLGETETQVISNDCELTDIDAVIVRTMPPGTLEQVVFRMDVLARLEASGCVVINPAKALEAAVDKYLALAKLQAAGLSVPKTFVCQSVDQAMSAFEKLGSDVVIKPLFGSEGQGIARLNDEALVLRAVKMLAQMGAVIYMQEFIPHNNYDIRLLVVGRRVLGMRRCNSEDWRTNVSRGAVTEAFEPDSEYVELAHRAVGSVGAPFAGVDLLPARDGRLLALEVNAVPGWKALARTLKVDVAKLVLEYVASVVNNGSE